MSFQINALPEAFAARLFALSDEALAEIPAKKITVDTNPGFPCRVSLADAEVGETVILVHYVHQPHNTPYKASHAIFVRQGVTQATPTVGEVPKALEMRVLSVRAFNGSHDMIDADVVDGEMAADSIRRMFKNPEVAYLHLHNAKPGCFAASVTRPY